MTNRERFEAALCAAYIDLFETDPEYAYVRGRSIVTGAQNSPEGLAARMTAGLANGSANKDGRGIRAACKAVGIKPTYKELRAYLNAAGETPTGGTDGMLHTNFEWS